MMKLTDRTFGNTNRLSLKTKLRNIEGKRNICRTTYRHINVEQESHNYLITYCRGKREKDAENFSERKGGNVKCIISVLM